MGRNLILILCLFVFGACASEKKENKKEESYQAPEVEDYVEHYSNGLKKIEGKKVDGKRHGKWIYYYDNGMKWSEGKYVHGERNGYSVVYYENGKKKIEGQYKKDLRVGKWKVWEDDGSLVKEIDLDKMLSAEDSLRLELK
ncbi:MAG: hypothetical protein WD530_05805 [Vicingaceae bacterium]